MANLLDVDESTLNTATQCEKGMALFVSFAAAFPPVEHAFVMKFFQHLGWPGWLLTITDVIHGQLMHYMFGWCSFQRLRHIAGYTSGMPTLTFVICHGHRPNVETASAAFSYIVCAGLGG